MVIALRVYNVHILKTNSRTYHQYYIHVDALLSGVCVIIVFLLDDCSLYLNYYSFSVPIISDFNCKNAG